MPGWCQGCGPTQSPGGLASQAWGGAPSRGSYLLPSLSLGALAGSFFSPHLTPEKPLALALCLKEQVAWAEGREKWGPGSPHAPSPPLTAAASPVIRYL